MGFAPDYSDIPSLTQYDAINIKNCFGGNPFSEAPIDTQAAIYLSQRLAEHHLSLNRDLQYVLPSEYHKVLDYLDGHTRAIPGLLKTSPAIPPMDADKLQTFMTAKGITSSIPVSAMTKSDFDRMYGYVLSKNQLPDCLKPAASSPTPAESAERFLNSIQIDGITEKKQFLLLQLRNQTEELLALGIDPNNIEEIEQQISTFRQNYRTIEQEKSNLSTDYKSLLALKQQLTYAESPSFIFGSLFDEKVHPKPEIIEKEERDTKQPKKELDTDIDM